ncbi:DUF5808 domain-containing protein [Intrasporangium sp. YIM S08009]|uniref:DUF5808 domain-containing protein n=1 Tax=Intrasporangium zincisolvens TaxID=3080018 RepID=UPI002B05E0BB|nr:DUF5808 domain-containing protein [Intrasporangium sp. YIM S08009]
MTSHRETKTRLNLVRLIRLTTAALAVAAVVKELRTPAQQRHWHGSLGFVPYDLRMPTFARIKERMWNPDNAQVISPRVFGVGWTVNIGRVVELARHRDAAG